MLSLFLHLFPLQITTYEERYGAENVDPIPARTRQADEMNRIMESFRKLREGLFASEARDSFAVHGEQKKLKDAMTTTRKRRLYSPLILLFPQCPHSLRTIDP